MKKISELILEKRKEHGLTQSELGKLLGISGKAVSKWERGLSKPCEEHMARLVNLIGLPVESPSITEEKDRVSKPTFFPLVRNEFIRILTTGIIIAVCVCNLAGVISTGSTVVSLGFSAAIFCLGTMIKK